MPMDVVVICSNIECYQVIVISLCLFCPKHLNCVQKVLEKQV